MLPIHPGTLEPLLKKPNKCCSKHCLRCVSRWRPQQLCLGGHRAPWIGAWTAILQVATYGRGKVLESSAVPCANRPGMLRPCYHALNTCSTLNNMYEWRSRDCSHFAWNNYNGGTCWLKKGPVSPGSAFHKSGVVCGYLPSRIDGAGGGGGAGSKYTFYLF